MEKEAWCLKVRSMDGWSTAPYDISHFCVAFGVHFSIIHLIDGDLWLQLAKLQEEQQKKEQRWTASMSRSRDRIEQLEQEKMELKQENQLLEQRRLEVWQAKKATDTITSAPPFLQTMVNYCCTFS